MKDDRRGIGLVARRIEWPSNEMAKAPDRTDLNEKIRNSPQTCKVDIWICQISNWIYEFEIQNSSLSLRCVFCSH